MIEYDGFKSCIDTHPKCSDLKSLCDSEALINKVSIKYVCPKTCKMCRDSYLGCSNRTDLCQNDGVCVDLTENEKNDYIAFKCECPYGFYGTFCELSNFQEFLV